MKVHGQALVVCNIQVSGDLVLDCLKFHHLFKHFLSLQ